MQMHHTHLEAIPICSDFNSYPVCQEIIAYNIIIIVIIMAIGIH